MESLPAEPHGKPKNTGVGSLSLLQQIFPTQESNWGLLHCGQILYQLSYRGNKMCPKVIASSVCTISAYKSFYVNSLLLDSGIHLYLYYTEMLWAAFT